MSSHPAVGLSPDGQYVAGVGDDGVPVLWSQSTGSISIGTQLGMAAGVAADGNAVSGTLGAGINQAFRWALSGGMAMLGFLPGGNVSQSAAISDDGQVVVGFSTSAFAPSGEGFVWTAAGGMTGVGDLPGGQVYSFANDVSGDGNVVVGWSRSTDNFGEAFRWSAGTLVGLGTLPGFTSSDAQAVSYDGSVIVGKSSNGTTFEATMWSGGTVINLGLLPGSDRSAAYDVSGDGKVVVGHSGEAMIWDAPNGMRSLRQVLENEYGLDLSGWSLGLALRLSYDGRVIVGRGTNPQGSLEIWRAVLNPAPLQVTEPLGNVTYVAGTEMTVRWNASGIDSVDILFSINAGDTAQVYDNLESGYPAATGEYTFTLPDTFSRQCAILLQSTEDASLFALSDTFRMKPYILTRVDVNGNYEPFKLNEDAWNFSNAPENLWPQSWWQQFDYANGTDPHTGAPYPANWPGWPIYARAQDFPDWQLFVDAFGTGQCYSNVGSASYALAALLLWRKKKHDWGGSCFGMATTSLLAFDDRSTFVNLFPGIPNFQELYFLQNSVAVRKAINQLFLYQWGAPHRAHYREVWQTPPSQTLFEIQQMLISEERDDRILVLISQDPQNPGAHAVVPYRVAAHETLANHYWIYVYDNNDPEDTYRRFLINLNDDTWSYLHFPTWGGAKGLFLANPVSEYLQQPQFGKNGVAAGLPFAHAGDLAEVGFSGTHSFAINNDAGQQSGYIDGTVVNEISEALPVIPITGFPHPPTGFEMPPGNYRIELSGYSDSLAYLSATLDSLQYLYGRNDALAGQRDFLSIAEGVGFSNPDPQSRSVNFLTVFQEPQRELGVDLSEIELTSGDSMHITMTASNGYQLRNFGGDSRYDLRLEMVSETAHPVFRHNAIVLPGNSAHLIRPDWSDLLNQPVKILIDLGNDGTVDDSIFIAHQPAGAGEPAAAVIPERYELLQNYPNPFNPLTNIRYDLPAVGEVELAVYNLIGQKIRTLVQQRQGAGRYVVQWDGTDDAGRPVASGIYFYRLSTGRHFVQARKMLLTR